MMKFFKRKLFSYNIANIIGHAFDMNDFSTNYLRATNICGYKFYRILEIVRLAGTHFSDFSKLAFYLFENVEKINIRGYNF